MKKRMNSLRALRDNRRKGMTMIFALCATALLLAFSLSVLYLGSALLATANRKAISERCYQKAVSFSSMLENQLTSSAATDLQDSLAARLDAYVTAPGVEDKFSFDYLVENEDIEVSFKTMPVKPTGPASSVTRVVTMYVTAREKGEQQTVTTSLNYNKRWTPRFQPAFVEGD